jgi:TetR/AcrR family transcriptional regulator, repressor for neighboring sulfatase
MPKPLTEGKPYGREQAMTELLKAATTLFAERGFDAVSVRDVCQLANVNHALLHRHFGTKENLLRAVMRREADRFTAAIGEIDDPSAALQRLFSDDAADIMFARLLAYMMLSKLDASEYLPPDGALKHIADRLTAMTPPTEMNPGLPGADARETTAIVSAMALGWLLFEPFLASATGLDHDQLPQTRARVQELVGVLADRSLTRTAPKRARGKR